MDTPSEIKYSSPPNVGRERPHLPVGSTTEYAIHNMTADIDSNDFDNELAELIVAVLNLDIDPAEIDPHAPLYGDEGLGLDSIDVLELSLAISKQYGIQLRSDDENRAQIFASLRNLGDYIQQHRIK